MVPLKDIEQSLNLSRGCMSYHYPTKQELFMDVIDQYILRKQDVDNKMQIPKVYHCMILSTITLTT